MLETGHHYRDQVSKIISWGHWFSFANILLALVLASRYLFIAEWPETVLGQTYALVSLLGHFSLLIFIIYLVVIFPLSFVIPFPRALRFVTVLIATLGMSLLIIDTEVFSQYNLHINPIIFEILLSKTEQELNSDWQSFFTFIPFLFLFELVASSLIWHRLRRLSRFKLGPIIAIFFFVCFLSGHLIYMWADAAVYRPVTAQKTNYPLSYPMTARTFLTKYGWIDQKAFDKRVTENDNTVESRLDYPKQALTLNPERQALNVLFINASTLRADMLNPSVMPEMAALAKQSQQFNQHFSTSNSHQLGNFSMLYGLSAQYADDIDVASTAPFMLDYFTRANYKLGIFASEKITGTRQQRTAFVNLSASQTKLVENTQADAKTVTATEDWLEQQEQPWFAYVSLKSAEKMTTPVGFPALFYPNIQDLNSQAINRQTALQNSYRNSVNYVDNQAAKLILKLKQLGQFDNTVIVFTSDHGTEFNDSSDHSWGYGSNYSVPQTQVPLFIVWPNMPAKQITQDTNHTDIVPTLLNNLNAVMNPTSDYSSGIDLFSGNYKPWQLLGDKNNFVILEPNNISIFSYQGLFTREGSHQVRNRENYKLNRKSSIQQAKLNNVLAELNYFYKAHSLDE